MAEFINAEQIGGNSASGIVRADPSVLTTGEFWKDTGKDLLGDIGRNISNWWNGSRINPSNWFNHMVTGKDVGGVGSSVKEVMEEVGLPVGSANPSAEQSTNSAQSVGKIAYTKTGIPYDPTNIDSQINALMTEYAYQRDDSSYDRLIAQLRKNGINPALVLGNAAPMSSDSGYRSNYNLTDKDQLNSALKAGSILAILLSLLMKR